MEDWSRKVESAPTGELRLNLDARETLADSPGCAGQVAGEATHDPRRFIRSLGITTAAQGSETWARLILYCTYAP
jgi:hypothetical protein